MPDLPDHPESPAADRPPPSYEAADSSTRGQTNFSTGPKTPEGKSTSSQNAITHGCCSHKLILPDEDEQEWLDLKQGWFDDYDPHTHAARALVYDAAVSHWLLLRARRRYYEAEWSLYSEQPDAMQWSDPQHQKIERFTRYRTTAERSFTRALNNVERLRKNRLQEAHRDAQHEWKAAEIESRRISALTANPQTASRKQDTRATESDAPKATAEEIFPAHNPAKKQRKIVTLEQWVEVSVEDGRTVTTLFPSNEQLIEEGKKMNPRPDLVYRRVEFIGSIPPEYRWTAHHPEQFEAGGAGVQRMTVDTWLDVVEREKNSGSGHIGPTGVGNLPRPKERGGCECETCARNREILETRNSD